MYHLYPVKLEQWLATDGYQHVPAVVLQMLPPTWPFGILSHNVYHTIHDRTVSKSCSRHRHNEIGLDFVRITSMTSSTTCKPILKSKTIGHHQTQINHHKFSTSHQCSVMCPSDKRCQPSFDEPCRQSENSHSRANHHFQHIANKRANSSS